MHALKHVRFALETALTRLGLLVVPRLPRRLAVGGARLAGTTAYLLAAGQRRVTLANLELAFGDRLAPRARRRIAREAFHAVALVIVDLFWFSRDIEDRVRRYVTMDADLASRVYTRPMIGVTGHFGNWELMSKALSVHGYPHVVVATPLQNPAVDAFIGVGRSIPGVEVVARHGAIRGILRALRQGRHVALLLDQNTKPEEGGVFVDFFGHPIPMSSAATVLSARTGAPVLPLFCRSRPDGTYTVYARPALAPCASVDAEAVRAATQSIAAVFEAEIRAQPGQWLWMYKRWKYIDPARPGAGYPFYAKAIRTWT